MDGKPGETPNPLNPSLDEQAAEQQNEPVAPEPVEVVTEEAVVSEPVLEPEPVSEAVAPEPMEVVAEETVTAVAPVAADTAEATKPKKKKTGLIVGMIVCFFIAAGCGVAALLFFLNNNSDPVKLAMEKIMGGDAPSNLAADGIIDVVPGDDTDAPYSKLSIALKTEAVPNFKANTASATISMLLNNGKEASIKFDEIYTADGDLYVRIDGIKNLANELTVLTLSNGTNCINDETGQTNCIEDIVDCGEDCELYGIDSTGPLDYSGMEDTENLLGFLGIAEFLDGQWIGISQTELALLAQNTTMDSNMVCLTDFVEDLGNYSNTMVDIYNKNPFVKSTAEGINITSKKDPLYRLSVDSGKLDSFMTEVQNTKPMTELFNCMGYENATVNIDNITEELENAPEVYVEIDSDHNFTRFYMNGLSDDGEATIKADFSLSYPTTINITEPLEYKSFLEIIYSLMPTEVVVEETTL